MNIRAVEPADAAEWLRMRTILWPAEGHERDIENFFHARVPHLSAVLVAEHEAGRLTGFIEIGLRTYAEGCESSPVPFIEGWFVDEEFRRAGVGRDLVRAAEQWALDRGFTEIGSDVELQNEDSIAAHRAIGYEEVGRVVAFRRTIAR